MKGYGRLGSVRVGWGRMAVEYRVGWGRIR